MYRTEVLFSRNIINNSKDSINKILGSELNKNLLEIEFWAWHQVYLHKLQGP